MNKEWIEEAKKLVCNSLYAFPSCFSETNWPSFLPDSPISVRGLTYVIENNEKAQDPIFTGSSEIMKQLAQEIGINKEVIPDGMCIHGITFKWDERPIRAYQSSGFLVELDESAGSNWEFAPFEVGRLQFKTDESRNFDIAVLFRRILGAYDFLS